MKTRDSFRYLLSTVFGAAVASCWWLTCLGVWRVPNANNSSNLSPPLPILPAIIGSVLLLLWTGRTIIALCNDEDNL